MGEVDDITVEDRTLGVEIRKGRAPLWPGLFLLPFACLCPFATLAAWCALLAVLFAPPDVSNAPSILLRIGLALMFLLGSAVPLWVLYHIVYILAPVSTILGVAGDEIVCSRYIMGLRVWRRRLWRTGAILVVQVYESHGDPCMQMLLRDRFRRECSLVSPVAHGAHLRDAENYGRGIAARVSGRLGTPCTVEYPHERTAPE